MEHHRLILHRSTIVHLVIIDEALFHEAFQDWCGRDPSGKREGFLDDIVVRTGTLCIPPKIPGVTITRKRNEPWLEPIHTCRVCGCTEDAACVEEGGSACSWAYETHDSPHYYLCSACAEKEVTNG